MSICSFAALLNQTDQPTVRKMALRKAVAFAVGLGLSMLSYPLDAESASGSDTVRDLYDELLSTIKNRQIPGKSGSFTQLEPVIRRSFDIASMARLSIGRSWASLTEAQRQLVTES